MFRCRKILLPLDGSALAERALLPAACIAGAMSARLLLLRVVPPPPINDALDLNELLKQEQETEAIAYLEDIKADLSSRVPEVKTAVIHGHPAKSIIHYAQDNRIDLIVMSSHGYSGLKRWILGSVATHVLRNALCSTLVIRAGITIEMFSHNHFLVPLDGAKLAEQALAPAMALAQAFSAKLTLFSALFSLEETVYQHHLEQIEREERIARERYLYQVMTKLSDSQVPMEAVIHTGMAQERIPEYADEQTMDLIIISSHGRSGIGLWAYGSVTEKILNCAHCAVLIVRGTNHN